MPFLARNGLALAGPVSARVILKSAGNGSLSFSWRTSNDKAFNADNRSSVTLEHSTEWQTIDLKLPADSTLIHVRVQVPGGVTTIKSLELKPASGRPVSLLR